MSRPMTLLVSVISVALSSVSPVATEGDALSPRRVVQLDDSLTVAGVGAASLGIGSSALAISPDGRYLAFIAEGKGEPRLWLRDLRKGSMAQIADTDGAWGPFFSPDGSWVGYLAKDQLWKVRRDGGKPVALCRVTNPAGGSWGEEDEIFVTQYEGSRLFSVSSTGDVREVPNGGFGGRPYCLNGRRAVLIAGWDGLGAVDLKTGDASLVLAGQFWEVGSPRYAAGHLTYVNNGCLVSVPFDIAELAIDGPSRSVLNGLRVEGSGVGQYDISSEGTLVFLPGRDEGISKLVWVDRVGNECPTTLPRTRSGTFEISPDGASVAAVVEGHPFRVDLLRLADGSVSRLTPVTIHGRAPIWFPDGTAVAFSGFRGRQHAGLFKLAVSTGHIDVLLEGQPEAWIALSDITPDGENLLIGSWTQEMGTDIKLLNVAGGNEETEVLVRTPNAEWGAVCSPDGEWMAHTTDQNGRYEIVVRKLDGTGDPVVVSPDGGEEAVWSQSAKELFYRYERTWYSVRYDISGGFKAEAPSVLFEGEYLNLPGRSYAVSADGRRFLVAKGSARWMSAKEISVVPEWVDAVLATDKSAE